MYLVPNSGFIKRMLKYFDMTKRHIIYLFEAYKKLVEFYIRIKKTGKCRSIEPKSETFKNNFSEIEMYKILSFFFTDKQKKNMTRRYSNKLFRKKNIPNYKKK